MDSLNKTLRNVLSVAGLMLLALCFQNCGSSGGGSSSGANGDWYYHWKCNGDAQCLATNPTGAASGDADEGPAEAACTSLLTFANHNWGSAAVDSCDQSPTGSGGTGTSPATDNIFAILNPVSTYWLCDSTGQPFLLQLTETAAGSGTGLYQRDTIAPSLIMAMTWQEGSDKASFTTNITSTFAGLIEIAPNAPSNPTRFTYLNGAKSCTLKSGSLPAIPQALGGGYYSQAGLIWMPNNADGKQTWSAANTYCTTSTINGTTGWRLPTYAEIYQFFSSGAVDATAQSNGWAIVSFGSNPATWTADSAGTGSHKSISENVLNGFTSADSTLNQVTCVK